MRSNREYVLFGIRNRHGLSRPMTVTAGVLALHAEGRHEPRSKSQVAGIIGEGS